MGIAVTLVDNSAPSGLPISSTNPLPMSSAAYPSGATPLSAGSGNVANASAVATLTPASGKTAYITGFQISGAGATVALPVSVTVVGLLGGTRTFTHTAVAGALLANTPLLVNFPYPIPASAVDTNIVVTCPALGAGNTNNTVNAQGFYL